MENLIIIGTGCAGYTAAIYAGRADLNPLILAGALPGGQLSTTTEVENFPGFPKGIQGAELMMGMMEQATRFGARMEYEVVSGLEPRSDGTIGVRTESGMRNAKAVIIATGASSRHLGLPNEKALIGKGLTSCATCDGAFYRNVPVCVVGGGDSAVEEANFLTRFASVVHLIHRRSELRASKIMADRLFENPKVRVIWDTEIKEYLTDSDGELTAVRLSHLKTGTESKLEVKCVFVAIGHVPNTEFLHGVVELDEEGYVIQRHGTSTNVSGVFAAGDVADRIYRQAITAAGQGCAAALDAERYLAHNC